MILTMIMTMAIHTCMHACMLNQSINQSINQYSLHMLFSTFILFKLLLPPPHPYYDYRYCINRYSLYLFQAYDKAVEEFGTNGTPRTSYDAWIEEKQKELDENAVSRRQRVKEEYEEKKQAEIEAIAREWAKREFFRKATAGDMPYSEDEYIKSVWERAMFEGDLKYRMMNGQETDERKELAEFKMKQEKKKATMLERAKAGLQEILDEDDKLVAANKKGGDDK